MKQGLVCYPFKIQQSVHVDPKLSFSFAGDLAARVEGLGIYWVASWVSEKLCDP